MSALALPDGRTLDVVVSGPATGPVLLWHHGTPGASTSFRLITRAAEASGLRTVTWSRPGYGSSDRQPGRSVTDVVRDAVAILDHLGVDGCVTAGWSGGGPHALATGALLPDRVSGVLAIASIAPFDAENLDFLDGMGEANVEEFGGAMTGEDALSVFLNEAAGSLRNAQAADLVTGMASMLPHVDRAILVGDDGGHFGEDLAASFREGLRTGVDGWLDDDLAFTRPWGFELDALGVPTFLWQGDQDLMVPYAHGQWLASHLPGVTAHLLPGEGHLSISVGALDRMLEELASTL